MSHTTLELRTQTRREFCAHSCRVASAAVLGGIGGTLLEGCSSSNGNPMSPSDASPLSTVNGIVSGRTISVSIAASSPLSAVGTAALVQTSLGALLVSRTGESSFTALTATCTHQACLITGRSNQTYVCPCHNSGFDTNGRVVNGPATAPLAQFATQFANDVLTISV